MSHDRRHPPPLATPGRVRGLAVLQGVAAAVALAMALGAGDEGAGPEPPDLPAGFVEEFGPDGYSRSHLRPAGGHPEVVKFTRQGLRIRIPKGLGKPAAIGLTCRDHICGDFAITADFTILQAETPTEGYGLGVQLWAETDAPDRPAATVERGLIPGKGERFTSTQIVGPPDKREYRPERAPASSRSGRLRLVRVGPTVHASFADGDAPFRLLRSFELGTGDLDVVRFAADTGVSDHPLDVLLRRLEVRAEALERPGIAGPETSFAGLLWWVVIGGCLTILVAYAVTRMSGR